MNPEKWQKIKAIFNEAVELAPDERESFLQIREGADAEIFAEVRKLLAAEKQNNFAEPGRQSFASVAGRTKRKIFSANRSEITKSLREIGRGGMGIVFEAVREQRRFFADRRAQTAQTRNGFRSDAAAFSSRTANPRVLRTSEYRASARRRNDRRRFAVFCDGICQR